MSLDLTQTLRPFRHSRYRLLALSLTLSLLGAGLLVVALVWQVVALGGGPADLSVVTTAAAVGMLLTTLVGGVLADRVPQRLLLMSAEAVKAVVVAGAAGLSLTGQLQLWHLAVAAFVGGVMDGIYYPAYSALLPALVPADDLLAANGFEGALRPLLLQALGPAAAGLLVAAWSPGVALAVTAAVVAAAVVVLRWLPPVPLRRSEAGPGQQRTGLVRDLVEGLVYLWRTPWLRATLAFASLLVLVIMGPLDVLLPFAIKDRAGGGPGEHAFVLAAYGIGGVVGALVVASWRLPRRYLTAMLLMWGVGSVPMAGVGLTNQVWMMALGAFVVGAAFEAGTVVWGTLLQRRVPPELLGRVSSLDFFVSLAFMPVSFALAGPVSEGIGMTATFLLAGLAPPAFAVVAIVAARMPRDELEHPLDGPNAEAQLSPGRG